MAMGEEFQRRIWGGVWSQVMVAMVLGLLVKAVSGAPAAMEPSSSGGEVECTRPLVDVVWGFILIFLALSISLWTANLHTIGDKFQKILILLAVIFMPITPLWYILGDSFFFLMVVRHCHKMKYGKMSFGQLCSLLNPFSKSPIRIIAGCNIIIYLRDGLQSSEESDDGIDLINESWMWEEDVDVEDESEGMVIGEYEGRERKSEDFVKRQLSRDGMVALIWGEYFLSKSDGYTFLPEYNEVKFLRGNSGFATIAIAIQAVGYIYAVVFRSVLHLRVSPIEVIGMVLNILLLIGASLYSTSNTCARPLVIYMNEKREEKLKSIVKSRPRLDFDSNYSRVEKYSMSSVGIIVICVCIPILVYFVIELGKATSVIVVMPLVIFGIGLLASLLSISIANNSSNRKVNVLVLILAILVNMVAYVLAVFVTFYYWKSQHFHTRSQELNWSQAIPFIG